MSFKVYINEGERDQIYNWVLKHTKIETGGDLFGLWLDDQTAVVQFVLGPGEKSYRTTTSFFQDVDYLRESGEYLTKYHGLCNVGQWHSHHRINLFKPSAGDEDTVWNNMPKLGLDRYVVFIANITDKVTINCFLFQIKKGRQRSLQPGKFIYLDGNSPLRLNENVLLKTYIGAERFNEITPFDKEMEYIRNRDVKDNRHNENESGTGGNTASRGHENVGNSYGNSYSPNRTAGKNKSEKGNTGGYVDSVQNTNQSIRYEEHRTQRIPYHNEGQLNNTTMYEGGCSALITVKMYETPNAKNTVTQRNVQKHPTNLPGAVLPNFDNQKRNQDTVYRTQVYRHQNNSSLELGDITSTDQASSGTDQEFQSDANQTIREASNRANINSAEPNFELKRAKEKVDGRNASTSVLQNLPETKPYNPTTRNTYKTKQTNPVNKQDIPNQPGQVDRTVSPDTTEAMFIGQTGTQTAAKVIYCGEVITQQPPCRNSVYDNVKLYNNEATPMEITDTQQEIRPETPSGIITGTANANQGSDSDDEITNLCGLFKKLNLCGRDRK